MPPGIMQNPLKPRSRSRGMWLSGKASKLRSNKMSTSLLMGDSKTIGRLVL
jgi:hypothetical protein